MASALEIFLFGGFRASVDGRPVAAEAWAHRRARDLVKVLALAPGHRLHREQIWSALWPELPASAAGANLRKGVHFARRALGWNGAVATVGPMVELAPGATVTVDTDTFEREALAALRSADSAQFAKLAASYSSPLLPEDLYEPWLDGPRTALNRRYLQLLRAGELWEQLVEREPLDEAAHRGLIRQHLRNGDRTGALQAYERLRRVLQEELGITPDGQSQALHREALADREPSPALEDKASVLLGSALLATHRGALDQAEREAMQARQLAAEAGLGRQLGEASALLGMVAHLRGRWRDLFLREFHDIVQRPAAVAPFVFDAHLCLAQVWLYGASGVAAGASFADELFAIADHHDSLLGRALACLLRGEAALLSGRLESAETDLAQAVTLHQRAGAASGAALAMGRLAERAVAVGDARRARVLAERAHEVARQAPMKAHLVPRILATKVDAASSLRASLDAVREGEDVLSSLDPCGPCAMPFRVAAAVACAHAGELTAAASYVEGARRIAGVWPASPWEAAEWEARAALRLAEGRPAQAAALFGEAAELFSRSGHVVAVARCRRRASEAQLPQ